MGQLNGDITGGRGRINPLDCAHCGRVCGPSGDDPCIENLPGVMNACCGHGESESAYIQYSPTSLVSGRPAFDCLRAIADFRAKLKAAEEVRDRLREAPHICNRDGPQFDTVDDGRQRCKCCGIVQQAAWSVPDDVWALLPERWQNRCLCLDCFGHLADLTIAVGEIDRAALNPTEPK